MDFWIYVTNYSMGNLTALRCFFSISFYETCLFLFVPYFQIERQASLNILSLRFKLSKHCKPILNLTRSYREQNSTHISVLLHHSMVKLYSQNTHLYSSCPNLSRRETLNYDFPPPLTLFLELIRSVKFIADSVDLVRLYQKGNSVDMWVAKMFWWFWFLSLWSF